MYKMSQITKYTNDWKLILDNVPEQLLLKSLILIDVDDVNDNIFKSWNELLLRKTNNYSFTDSHIHTFSETFLTSNNREWKHHLSSKDQIAFEMLLLIKFQSMAKNIVIISSSNLILSQLERSEKLFPDTKFIFINRIKMIK